MPIPGSEVHRQLMAAQADLHAKLTASREELADDQRHRDHLRDDRSDALLELAQHYLPDLTAESIRASWAEVRASLQQILLRKEDAQRRTHEAAQELQSQRSSLEQELVAAGQRCDQALARQEQLSKQVETKLREDQEFVVLSDRAAVAEAALERAEANLEQVEQDAATKLPAYEQSDFFTYLSKRRFGTAEYKQRGLTRRIDRWVARMIDYSKARQSYDFLHRTPETMRKIIAADRSDLQTVMKELERMRDQAAAAVGLPEQLEAVAAAGLLRDRLIQQLDQVRQQSSQLERELNDFENPCGPYYREAVEQFRGLLERTPASELNKRACGTQDMTDDQIVARLRGIDTKVDQLDEQAADQRRDTERQQERLDSLGRMIQRYRVAGFDSARAQFPDGLDLFELLDDAEPDHDLDRVWRRIRESQSWGPTVMDRVTEVATHPMTQVLINAMAHAAAGAMTEHARRAGRRGSSRRSRWP